MLMLLDYCWTKISLTYKIDSYVLPKIEERSLKERHTQTKSKYFAGHRRLSQSEESECMWTHNKDDVTRDAIFVMCSHTFTLFWLRKTSVTVKISWFSFRVFACTFLPEISSIFVSFPFPFLYFVLFILRYFPFHVVWYLCLSDTVRFKMITYIKYGNNEKLKM